MELMTAHTSVNPGAPLSGIAAAAAEVLQTLISKSEDTKVCYASLCGALATTHTLPTMYTHPSTYTLPTIYMQLLPYTRSCYLMDAGLTIDTHATHVHVPLPTLSCVHACRRIS